jgi:hypothetical protein
MVPRYAEARGEARRKERRVEADKVLERTVGVVVNRVTRGIAVGAHTLARARVPQSQAKRGLQVPCHTSSKNRSAGDCVFRNLDIAYGLLLEAFQRELLSVLYEATEKVRPIESTLSR